MLVSNMLKAARALLGVKQSDLARAAGISLATLNNFERGIGDPRASTMDAIERALARGGITFSGDSEHDVVTLRKLLRPSAFDTYNASREVLEALDRSSLLRVRTVLFYRNNPQAENGENRQHVAILVEGPARVVLFDQARFSLASSSHIAEVTGIMLAAFALYRDRIRYAPDFISDTTRLPPAVAVDLLRQVAWRNLSDPADFLDLFGIGAERIASLAMRNDHPLHNLLQVTASRLRH